MRKFRIQVYDENLDSVGRIGDYLTADVVLKHNAIGSWSLLLNLDDPHAALIAAPGRRVVIRFDDDNSFLMSGPVDSWEEVDEVGGVRTIAVAGYDDLFWLDQRLVYPTPTATFPADGTAFTQAAVVDYHTGSGEAVVKYFVARNAVARFPVPGLSVAGSLGRGAGPKSIAARMLSLLWVCTEIANNSGLGVTVKQSGSGLVFDVYEPQDQPVRLSRPLGNLTSYRYKALSPTATHAVAGGTGEKLARKYMRKHVSDGGWGDREKYVDATDVETDAELAVRLDEFLAESSPTAGFSLTPQDTAAMRYGRDYNIGDRVRVELPNGLLVADTVREVKLSSTSAEGMSIVPGIGYTESTDPTAAIYRAYAGLRDEVANMKRSV